MPDELPPYHSPLTALVICREEFRQGQIPPEWALRDLLLMADCGLSTAPIKRLTRQRRQRFWAQLVDSFVSSHDITREEAAEKLMPETGVNSASAMLKQIVRRRQEDEERTEKPK